MSMRPSDDPKASLHDAAFDAAWQAMSSEGPPPAKDTAILAAARRAVDAGPRRVPEATRPARLWAPLAAAATIGAIAIGILQLAAPDKNGAPATAPGIVTDMPAAPAQAPKADTQPVPGRQRIARTDADADVPVAAKDAGKSVIAKPRAEGRADAIPAPAPAPSAPEVSTPRTSAPIAPAPVASAPSPTVPPAAMSEAPAPAAPAAPVPKPSVVAESAPAGIGAVTPSPAAKAFPAASAERREMAADESRSSPQLQGKLAAGSAADAGPASRALSPGPLPVAEWLTLIRRLRAEGRTDEAAKELAAFRLAHPDEARRLPDDLRDWRPPDK